MVGVVAAGVWLKQRDLEKKWLGHLQTDCLQRLPVKLFVNQKVLHLVAVQEFKRTVLAIESVLHLHPIS